MFESLAAFRAHCGEPTMPIEQCPICSRIPAACSRENVDCMVEDDRPPEMLQLEPFISCGSDGDISRCPTCHRLYCCEMTYLGAENYHAAWNRYDVDELFDVEWCVAQRLPDRSIWWVLHGLIPDHAIVRLEDEDGWIALDHDNRLTAIDGKAALDKLIERTRPRVTGDLELARRYAGFVNSIENPTDRPHDTFDSIVWRQPLWDFEQQRVDQARAASRVEAPVTERVGDQVRVRFWVTSGQRLICRVITVQPDGRYLREDVVTADYLPLPSPRRPCFDSLDAFRAHCGQPTMPLEQCPICSKLPERCTDDEMELPEIKRLEPIIDDDVRRCPTCRRLYLAWSFSGGNDIYAGNRTSYHLDRYSVDALFDDEWSVRQRVPERRLDSICSDRFFPDHLLVRFGAKTWGALDAANRLVMLDGHDAIVKLVELDPPRVLADLELAKRYAVFIDTLERPEDDRPEYFQHILLRETLTSEELQQIEDVKAATGLPTIEGYMDLRPTAERDGDRVIVRSWITSQRCLICRMLTVRPSGQLIVEDAVIAENLPLR